MAAESSSDHLNGATSASTLEELAAVISTLFPRLEAEVTGVTNGRIELRQPERLGLRPGHVVSVYRSGDLFRHPLTGVPMARSEKALGLAVIESVSENQAVAVMIPPAAPAPLAVRVGDQVRMSGEPLPIVVLSDPAKSMAVVAQFRLALEETGRFRVLSMPPMEPVPSLESVSISAGMVADAELADRLVVHTSVLEAVHETGADYLFFFEPSLNGGVVRGIVAIVEALTGQHVDAVDTPLKLDPSLDIGETADPLLEVMASQEGRAFREARFPYRAEHLVIGDLNGDAEDELVVSDGLRLRVYRIDTPSPELIAEEEIERHDRRQLAIDVAHVPDLPGPYLFVTAMIDDRLDSYVLQWKEGTLVRVVEHQPYYFRVIHRAKRDPMIVAQRRSLRTPFYGPVMQMEWTGTEFREAAHLALPSAVTIYDFAFIDVDRDGDDEILYWDADDFIVLANVDGELIGRSDEAFGGVETFFEYVPAGLQHGTDRPLSRARIPGRLMVADLDRDGTMEIMVAKNVPLTKRIERVKGYRFGQVYALTWDGQQFQQQWVIPHVEGVIADISIVQFFGADAGPQVMILTTPTFKDKILRDFFASRSQLLLYTLPQG